MNLSNYVQTNKIILSQSEIRELFIDRIINQETIIRTQLPLVLNLASSFAKTTGNNLEELFSETILTLIRAIETYDEYNRATFTTYFKTIAKNALINYSDNTIRTPINNKNIVSTTPFSRISYDFGNIADNKQDESRYNPKKMVELLQKYTKPKQCDIIIKKLGLTGDTISLKEIAKEYKQTKQCMQMHYTNGINNLKDKIPKSFFHK